MHDRGFEPVAAVVERLSVLLAAGVIPASAWSHVAGGSQHATAVAAGLEHGDSVAEAILESLHGSVANGKQTQGADAAWRGLAAAWQVATQAGAPLAPTLATFASSLRDLAENERSARTALAAPAATARMVVLLPVVGILFGIVLGFDPLGTLVTTGPGLACLAIGVLLMSLARWWSRRLVARASRGDATPGLGLDLVAIAVSGGAALPRALATVAAARERCGLPPDGSAGVVDEVLDLSRRAGVPAAALLRSSAQEARRDARAEGERRSATLSVTLMLPLGLCVLPAFMLLGVAPLLISIVGSTVTDL